MSAFLADASIKIQPIWKPKITGRDPLRFSTILFLSGIAFAMAMPTQAFAAPKAPACTAAQMKSLLAKPSKKGGTYTLTCTPKLTKKNIIYKKVAFNGAASSGVTLDCKGGKLRPRAGQHAINIISKKTNGVWVPPTHITVKNCQVDSGIRLWGARGDFFNASWKKKGHTARMQAVAPQYITFDRINMNMSNSPRQGVGIYLGHGVNHVTIKNSKIKGNADLAIYMSAESGHNNVIRNSIAANTLRKKKYCKRIWFRKICIKYGEGREQIALDGSAYNVIKNNRFSGLSKGGVYLYRNCGENGFVRHQTPHHNRIESNFFYYKNYNGRMPAVWLSNRDGYFRTEVNIFGYRSINSRIRYCGSESKYKLGSGKSNLDYARKNVVINNTHSGVGPRTFIKEGRSARNKNTIKNNVGKRKKSSGTRLLP